MDAIQSIMHPQSICEDLSFNFGGGMYQLFDHAEGEHVTLTERELIEVIACAIAGNGCEPDDYCRQLAVNVFANRNDTGLARFMWGLMP